MFTLEAAQTLRGVATNATVLTYTVFGMELASATETYKVIAQGQLAATVGTLYTVPASTSTFIKEIRIINTGGSLQGGVIIYIGGTAATNQITSSMSIPPNGMLVISEIGIQMFDNLGNILTAHANQNANGVASVTATSGAINTTETIVTSYTIPANSLQVGTTFRLTASGTCTSSVANASNFRVRIGTAGNNTDNIAAVVTPTAAASGTNVSFEIEFLVTVRTIGSSGTILGVGVLTNNGVTGVSAAASVVTQTTATVTINTTVALIIQLSYIAAAATTTCTFYNGLIAVEKQ